MNILRQFTTFITSFIFSVLPMNQYVEGVIGQPASFLPHQAHTQTDVTISGLVFRGLFTYDNFGNLVPDLAESWSTSSDGLVYTVTIKNDQYWSDGTKIDSDDVIYTSFKLADLQYVGTDKIDERTVRFILPNEYASFLTLLTGGIMQDQTEEHYSGLMPPTSGPFHVLRLERSGPIVKDVVLTTEDPDKKLKKMVFRYYSNNDELVTAAKLGEIDAFLTDSTVELENFKNHKFPVQGVYFALFFNMNSESLKEAETRKKLDAVINKEQLIYEKGILVEGPLSRSPYTDRALVFDTYDKTLKEDLDIGLTLTIPDLKSHREIAESIKIVWKDRLGVRLKIDARDPVTFIDEVVAPRNYEILLYGQETSRDPGRYVNWHSTQKEHPGLNLSNFEHVRSDRALEEGRKELDNDVRAVHYNEFQKVILEQVPAIFLYHPYKNFYVTEFIEGIGSKYTFDLSDRFLDFDNWSRISTN